LLAVSAKAGFLRLSEKPQKGTTYQAIGELRRAQNNHRHPSGFRGIDGSDLIYRISFAFSLIYKALEPKAELRKEIKALPLLAKTYVEPIIQSWLPRDWLQAYKWSNIFITT
jgi:hypothetical protein